jgi:hypothetical protein
MVLVEILNAAISDLLPVEHVSCFYLKEKTTSCYQQARLSVFFSSLIIFLRISYSLPF